MNRPCRLTSRCLLLAILVFAGPAVGKEWSQYAGEKESGWSTDKLAQAREFAKGIGSAAVMVVDHGHVVAAWGAVDHQFKMASIRKSLYDAAIGATHYEKKFDIDSSLGKLQINDLQKLSSQERKATFEQLLTARSGVYHPAAYETSSNARRRPQRNSAAPGTAWYYNNWDFNVIPTAFEQLSGHSMTDAFRYRVARRLGMEDFHRGHFFEYLEPRKSLHPALTVRLSARDLARVGKLYLQNGEWDGTQIVASEWVARSTKPHTSFEAGHYRGEGNGYGRLWWIHPARPELGLPIEAHHRISARGAGGQIMVLIPELDLLMVHLADTDKGRGIRDPQVAELLNRIVDARKRPPADEPKLQSLVVEPLSGRSPAPLRVDLTKISKPRLSALSGRYESQEGSGLRLYVHEGRLFAQSLGMPLNDVELLLASDQTLRSPVVGIVVVPIKGKSGAIDSIRATFRGRTLTGKRVE